MKRQWWTKVEDGVLSAVVDELGVSDWNKVAEQVPERTAKQCRTRWCDQLTPYRTRDEWTDPECDVLLQLVEREGPRWALISRHMLGRTANDVKNRYVSLVAHNKASSLTPSSRRPRQKKSPSCRTSRLLKTRISTVVRKRRARGGAKFTLGAGRVSLSWDWW